MSPAFVTTAAVVIQLSFVAIGLRLAWRHVFGPDARAQPVAPRLPRWDASLPEVLLFFLHGITGGFIGSFAVGLLAKSFGLEGDALAISATAALHVGALVGIMVFVRTVPHAAPAFTNATNIFLSGAATFLMAMPFVFLTNMLWLGFLKLIGLEYPRQPAVEMVGRLSDSPWLALFIVSAILIAPATEELLFRAGLFRYLRTHQRRWVALVAPSLVFAAIHLHLPSYLPLAMLGVVFSLAYERTGAIGTPIVAHAIFNLNNLVMLLAGVEA